MSPFHPLLLNLLMVAFAFYIVHINKSTGRRLLYDQQLARYQRRAMIPGFIYFMALLLSILWQSRSFLLTGGKSSLSLPPAVVGSLIGLAIAMPIILVAAYFQFRRYNRYILTFKVAKEEVLAAVLVSLEECGINNARTVNSLFFGNKIEFAGGKITYGSFQTVLFRLTIDIKPEERLLEIRNQIIENLREHFKPIAETAPPLVRFSLRTLLLATLTIGGVMGLYSDLQPWFKVTEWRPHKSECSRIQYSADGKKLLTQSLSGKPEAAIWDAQTLAKIADLPPGFTCDAAFSKDGNYVALGGASVIVCNAASGKVENEFAAEQANVLAFSPDGKFLAIGSSDNTLKLWNIKEESVERSVTEPAEITALAYSPDGKGVVTGLSNSDLNFRQASDGKMKSKRGYPSMKWRTFTYSADGRKLLSAGDYNFIISWSSDGDLKDSYYLRDERPNFIQYSSAKGDALVCGNQVQIFELGKYESKEQFAGYTRAHFSPDGLHIATAGTNTAAIWERRTSGEWWSFIKLPTFWIAFAAFIGLIVCFWSDVKAMKTAALAEVK